MISVAALFATDIRSGTKINIEGKHTLYFYSCSSNCSIVDVDEDSEYPIVYLKSSLKGESVVTEKRFAEKYLNEKKATKVFSENLADITNEYYYSPLIPVYKLINGQKVNVHVSEKKGVTTVGVPLIFGSY